MDKKRWAELLTDATFRDRSPQTVFDGRNPFEKDYGRLISSSPIRRLQDKTQVFPLEQSDYIRTRLTHSLEVSYIGSSIGTSVEKFLLENDYLDQNFTGYLSSLLRVAGLVHDLGNPSFGHFGEEAIKKFFTDFFNRPENKALPLSELEKRDFMFFDGNAQAFRILRRLHYFGDEFSYNLTLPSLASIIKYPSNSVEGNIGKGAVEIRKKKFGYFASEAKEYTVINELLKLNNKRHPVVYLMEAADDIAYCAADLEDGVKLGILNLEDVKSIFKDQLKENADLLKSLDELCTTIKSDPSDKAIIVVQRFRVLAQSRMIGAVIKSFEENYEAIMKGELEEEIINISAAKDIRAAFKTLQYIVFDNKKIMQTELAGWEAIYGLLDIFIRAIFSKDPDPKVSNKESRLYKSISSSYRYIYEQHALKNYSNEVYNKIQLIVDFISGMTDSYTIALFQKLKGITT